MKLNLLSWPNGGCPIQYYTVEYRRRVSTEPWILVASKATENLVIRDLKTASWYCLRLTAHNDAGSTQTQMEFATTTLSGVSIGPPNDLIMEDDVKRAIPNHKVLYVVLPLVCAIVLIISAGILGYVMLKRSGRCARIGASVCCAKTEGVYSAGVFAGRITWGRCCLGSSRINSRGWD